MCKRRHFIDERGNSSSSGSLIRSILELKRRRRRSREDDHNMHWHWHQPMDLKTKPMRSRNLSPPSKYCQEDKSKGAHLICRKEFTCVQFFAPRHIGIHRKEWPKSQDKIDESHRPSAPYLPLLATRSSNDAPSTRLSTFSQDYARLCNFMERTTAAWEGMKHERTHLNFPLVAYGLLRSKHRRKNTKTAMTWPHGTPEPIFCSCVASTLFLKELLRRGPHIRPGTCTSGSSHTCACKLVSYVATLVLVDRHTLLRASC